MCGLDESWRERIFFSLWNHHLDFASLYHRFAIHTLEAPCKYCHIAVKSNLLFLQPMPPIKLKLMHHNLINHYSVIFLPIENLLIKTLKPYLQGLAST